MSTPWVGNKGGQAQVWDLPGKQGMLLAHQKELGSQKQSHTHCSISVPIQSINSQAIKCTHLWVHTLTGPPRVTSQQPHLPSALHPHRVTGLRRLQPSSNQLPKGHCIAATTRAGFQCSIPKPHSIPATLPLLPPGSQRASSLLRKGRSPPEPGASLMNFWPDMKSPQEC